MHKLKLGGKQEEGEKSDGDSVIKKDSFFGMSSTHFLKLFPALVPLMRSEEIIIDTAILSSFIFSRIFCFLECILLGFFVLVSQIKCSRSNFPPPMQICSVPMSCIKLRLMYRVSQKKIM